MRRGGVVWLHTVGPWLEPPSSRKSRSRNRLGEGGGEGNEPHVCTICINDYVPMIFSPYSSAPRLPSCSLNLPIRGSEPLLYSCRNFTERKEGGEPGLLRRARPARVRAGVESEATGNASLRKAEVRRRAPVYGVHTFTSCKSSCLS